MPCISQPNLTPTQKQQQEAAIKRLQAALGAGTVSAVVSPTGAIAFRGWTGDKGGVSDICAYRALSASNSPELRRAIARAEAMAGRKIDARAIAHGTHSHDGGRTWGDHHHH